MRHMLSAIRTRYVVAVICVVTTSGLFVAALSDPSLGLHSLRFNPYAVLSAMAVVANLVLWGFYVSKPARTEERSWLSLYLLGLGFYAFAELMLRLSGTPTTALFWYNIENSVVVAFPAVYLFTLAYTNQGERRFPGVTGLLLLTSGIFIVFESFTNLLFINSAKVAVLMPWGYDFRNAVGPAAALILVWYYGFIVASFVQLMHFRRHTRNAVLRKQSLLFILAISIPLVGGTLSDLVLPGLNVTSIPSLSGLLGIPTAALLVYGVLRYQLLTISPALFSNTVLSIMQEAVVVTDKDFNIIFLNAEAETLLGVLDSGQRRASLLDHVVRSTLPKFQEAFKSGEDDKKTLVIDRIDIARAHAANVPVRVMSSALQLGDYQTRVIVLTDITAELQTRSVIEHEVKVRTEELHRAQSYLVSSIGSLEQGFILVNPKARIELTNQVAAKLLQQSSDQLHEVELSGVAKRLAWNADLSAMVDRVLNSRHGRQVDVEAADGSFFKVYVTPIIAGAHVLGATVVIEDITEQRILDRSKEEFFSIASHELRTPLTAIRGNMSMLKDYFPDAMKDQSLAAMVDDTHNASVRLIAIVNDFLDTSKLEQGKMEFSLQPVSLQTTIEAVQNDLRTLFESQHATVTLEGVSKLPQVMVDEGRFRQILYNLLSNAVKYGNDGNAITISADSDGRMARIHVSDNGKGISPENQKLLFHKFQQAGDSILTRDDTKGTGLGLYISKLLATNMHGDVALERTEVGKGSTFVVTLPLAKGKPKAAKPVLSGQGAGAEATH